MNPKILEEIGLSEGESKVYLALLRIGETKTGLLAKEAEVSSSKVYKILDRLIKKGLAGYVTKGKVKHFTAVEPKRVLDYLDEREKKLKEQRSLVEKIIPKLELEKEMGKASEAMLYNGYKAVTNFFLNILNDLEKGDEYFVIGAMYAEIQGVRAFFQNYHTQRVKKGINLKMLANYETKGNLVESTLRLSEIRFLSQDFLSNMQITFYKDKAFIIIWTKYPTGILIQNKEAVEGFKSYFNTFWKISEER